MIELDKKAYWIKNIRRVKSPNCDNRPNGEDISLIVVHGISLPPGKYGGRNIDRLFTNTLNPDVHPYFRNIAGLKVSAHLLINRRGSVTQYVPFPLRAWHAGESSFEGCSACNDFSIGIELEGCDEEPYEDVQYKKLASIAQALMKKWPFITKSRIIGHHDIAAGRKTDPGPAFDWGYFYQLIS